MVRKEKQKTTRASSFRNMIEKYAVRQTLEGIERKYKISGTLRRRNISMLHPSSQAILHPLAPEQDDEVLGSTTLES